MRGVGDHGGAYERADRAAGRTIGLLGLAAKLAGAVTRLAVADVVIGEAARTLGATTGALWVVDEPDKTLILVGSAGSSATLVEGWTAMPTGDDTPFARAVMTGQAMWLERGGGDDGLGALRNFVAGVAMVACLPLRLGEQPVGALALGFDRRLDDDERPVVELIALTCANALARATLYARERERAEALHVANGRARFMAEATALLTASLDEEATLDAFARLAVPRLADWCVIEVAGGAERSEGRIFVAHSDPRKVEQARAMARRYPRRADERSAIARVLRSGRSELVPDITEADIDRVARDAEHARLMLALGPRAAIIVPLVARSRTIGAMTLASAESKRIFGADDVSFAEELASRAALAIDNARLYSEATVAIAKRDEFLSVASHELKTPLTSLALHIDGLLRFADGRRPGALSTEMLFDRLRKAKDQCHRLTVLINQLLDVTRIRADRLELEPRETDLAALVRDVVGRFEEVAQRSRATIAFEAPSALVGVWDPDRLDQIIGNVVSNAVKYGAGKPVDVRVERTANGAQIVVRDRGPGVQAEDRERIFERFERAPANRQVGGIGLGLWIAREMARAHGGDITVTSELGQGATFSIEVPLTPVKRP